MAILIANQDGVSGRIGCIDEVSTSVVNGRPSDTVLLRYYYIISSNAVNSTSPFRRTKLQSDA